MHCAFIPCSLSLQWQNFLLGEFLKMACPLDWVSLFFYFWFSFILTFLNLLECVKVQALTPEHPDVKTSFP